ncbi:MAG: hypothetical protein K0B37_09850 [Bacteroidales bacterium]|nr:hypothetical protein [Bacteroidales bacterium]
MQINIEQFGPQELDILRKEIQSSLDEIKSRHGLSQLSLGTIQFNLSSFNAKVFGKVQNPVTEKYEQNEAIFFATRHGLPHNFIGSEFLLDGSVYTITQLVTSRPKYPITAYCEEDGRTFKFTAQRIKELLETARVINIPCNDEEPT